MSRKIDYNNLSQTDLLYIGQRDWLVREAVMQGYADVPARVAVAQGRAPRGRGKVTVAKPVGDPIDLGVLQDSPLVVEPPASEGTVVDGEQTVTVDAGAEGDEQEEDWVDYPDWTTQELRDECKGRGIASTGNKESLIQRLRQSDASQS